MSASRLPNPGQTIFISQRFDLVNSAGYGGPVFWYARGFTSITEAKWAAIDSKFPAIAKLTFDIRSR